MEKETKGTWKRTESPDPHIYGHLIYERKYYSVVGMDCVFNKQCSIN